MKESLHFYQNIVRIRTKVKKMTDIQHNESVNIIVQIINIFLISNIFTLLVIFVIRI